MTKIVFFFENTAKIQNIFSCSLRISSIFGKYGVLRGYTLIIYKEVSYFFMLLFMMIFFAASEIKVKEINALCKQHQPMVILYLYHHRLMFYFIC